MSGRHYPRRGRDSDHGANCHQHDQSTLGAGHVEIGPHLGAIVIERLGIGVYIAFPVDDDGWPALGGQGQCVCDAGGRGLFTVFCVSGVDREFSQKPRPQRGDFRQGQTSNDTTRQLLGRKTRCRIHGRRTTERSYKVAGTFGEGSRNRVGFPRQDFFHELVEDQPAFAAALDSGRRLEFARLFVN